MLPRYGSYEAIRRLAIGGMGEIFLARQVGIKGFERLAIIKTLLNESEDDEDRIEMFLAEARIAALLNHPNIVQIYEVGEAEGTYYMAMEYVDGDTLSAVVRAALRQQKHSMWPFAAFIAQSARALHHAHHQKDAQGKQMSLVHRDISPQNIMVRRDGVTKVVDFGIAKVSNSGHRTKTGVLKGKVAYMSPEQMRSLDVDSRTDLFALGVVLWELTCGKRMFPNKSDIEIITHVMSNKVPRPTSVVPNYPNDLEWVCMKAMAQDPAHRFQTGDEMADALDEILRRRTDEEKPALGPYVDELVGESVRERTTDLASSSSMAAPVTRNLKTPASGSFNLATDLRTAPPVKQSKAPMIAAGVFGLVGLAAGGYAALKPDAPVVTVAKAPDPPDAGVLVTIPWPGRPRLDAGPSEQRDAGVAKVADKPDRGDEKKSAPRDPKPRSGNSGNNGNNPGGTKTVIIERQAPAQSEDGYLTLQAEPWAVVSVDGKPLGSTPIFKQRLAAGKHNIVLTNEAQALSKTMSVTIEPGEVTKLNVALR